MKKTKKSNPIREYRHFLSYDMLEPQYGIEYGLTHLYYDHNQSDLFIKKVDTRFEKTLELQFPLKYGIENLKMELEDFLFNYMSVQSNFIGMLEFESSEMFSIDSLKEIYKKAIDMWDEKEKVANEAFKNNELIKFCKENDLYPQFEGASTNIWVANCISGGNHKLIISTDTNTWSCGYCRKKGNIDALKKWFQKKNLKA